MDHENLLLVYVKTISGWYELSYMSYLFSLFFTSIYIVKHLNDKFVITKLFPKKMIDQNRYYTSTHICWHAFLSHAFTILQFITSLYSSLQLFLFWFQCFDLFQFHRSRMSHKDKTKHINALNSVTADQP